jgi:Na+/H+ antiporter NhaC
VNQAVAFLLVLLLSAAIILVAYWEKRPAGVLGAVVGVAMMMSYFIGQWVVT